MPVFMSCLWYRFLISLISSSEVSHRSSIIPHWQGLDHLHLKPEKIAWWLWWMHSRLWKGCSKMMVWKLLLNPSPPNSWLCLTMILMMKLQRPRMDSHQALLLDVRQVRWQMRTRKMEHLRLCLKNPSLFQTLLHLLHPMMKSTRERTERPMLASWGVWRNWMRFSFLICASYGLGTERTEMPKPFF